MAFRIPGETAAEERFRQRTERVRQAQEEQEKKHHDMVARQIAHRELQEDLRKWHDRMAFDIYLLADRILELLIQTRDDNAPKDPDGEWNDAFCMAIELLPEAIQFAEDCMMWCTEAKNNE